MRKGDGTTLITKRPLVITDLETTGLNPKVHEITEIGLIVVEQKSLNILDIFEHKIKTVHIETAIEFALKHSGYNEKDWEMPHRYTIR